MSVYNSPGSSNNDHIRHLLHQRTAPLLHAHFPAPSDFPDSPSSVYSHAQFTPRPVDTNDLSTSLYHFSRLDRTPLPPVSDRQRFNHPGQSPQDTHSSEPSSGSSHDQDRSSYCTEQDDEPEHRMSMLGIKMRFHSRAPWEIGEDDIVEEDEPDGASIHRPPSRSKRSLMNFGNGPRPSAESNRSVGKRSFETSSSQVSAHGALQVLTQASMSTSSLSLTPPPPPGQNTLRQKLSLPRLRTRTTSNQNIPAVAPYPYSSGGTSPHSTVTSSQTSPSSIGPGSPTRSEYSQVHLDTHSVISRSPSPLGHPYANPELSSFTHGSHLPRSSSQGEGCTIVNSNDSLTTLTSSGPTNSSICNYASSIYSTHSTNSSPLSVPKDRIGPKDISAPLPLGPSALPQNLSSDGRRRETRIFPTPIGNGIAGWQEPPPSAFTLISLEEARAQRTRNITMQTGNDESGGSNLAFPPSDQVYPSPSGPSILTRPRGRSTSSGGKAKHAGEYTRPIFPSGKLEPSTPEGGSGGKSLKHKKSGFMRIFGKEKDRVPITSSPLLSGFSEVIPPVPRTPKISTHRVPVPSLSPRPDAYDDVSADSHDSHEGTVGGHTAEQLPSSNDVIPSLFVDTNPSADREFNNAQYLSAPNGLQRPVAPFGVPILSERHPQSAPATTDFLGFKLRPVSTLFSSHFSDHLLDLETALSDRGSEPSLVTDSDTPTTNSSRTLPPSPDSSLHVLPRSGLDKVNPMVAQDDSQSEVVRVLQAQIPGAKQTWQRHIWELEGQVRDLKAEIEELKHAEGGGDYCGVCGRGHRRAVRDDPKVEIIHRPRAHTAISSRFGNTLEV